MALKNLWWIIPLCLLIFGSIGYIKGTLDGANLLVEKCNEQYVFQNQLCDLECKLQDSVLNTLEYYEKRGVNVALDIETMNNTEILEELKKYKIGDYLLGFDKALIDTNEEYYELVSTNQFLENVTIILSKCTKG